MVSYGLPRVSPTCTWSPGHSAHVEFPQSWHCPVLPITTSPIQRGHAATDSTSPAQGHLAPAAHTDTVQGTHKTLCPQWILSVILVELNWVRASDWECKAPPFLCSGDLDHSAGWCWFNCPEAEWLFEFRQCPAPGSALTKGICEEEVHPSLVLGFLGPAECSFSDQTFHLL